ncbi:MAG: SMP-30/gluconolactonase/LRE family protein [Pseudomonadota bacterium]
MLDAALFKDTACDLGEGPLWDGEALWFFDILAPALNRIGADGGAVESWDPGAMASAAARLADGRLLVATERDLTVFDRAAGSWTPLCPLEADTPDTRSNDGRADRQGGFWIGTMGKTAAPGAGALYRYYRGTLRKLLGGMSIPNAICFAPDGRRAYFADSAAGRILAWTLDAEGWPIGAPRPFFEMTAPGEAPDGAVVDADGAVWVAIWGGARVQQILPDGRAGQAVSLPVPQPTCPALTEDGRLFVTTARQGLDGAALAAAPLSGALFAADLPIRGLPEPLVHVP